MSATILSNTQLKRSQETLFTDMEDEIIMMGLEQGKYYHLNPTGTSVWKLLGNVTTIADIVDSLMLEYEIDLETCQQEVNTLVQKLAEEDLIELVE